MARAALGFRAHLGWATAVAVTGTRRAAELATRDRVELSSDRVPESHEPYHEAALVREDEARARAIVDRGARAIHAAARRNVRALVRALERDGAEVVAAGVLLDLGRKSSFASTLASHALVHTAEGQLMRAALVDACERAGLRVVGVRERDLVERAAAHLALAKGDVASRVAALGAGHGPPWREEQKKAALVAWLALAGLRA